MGNVTGAGGGCERATVRTGVLRGHPMNGV